MNAARDARRLYSRLWKRACDELGLSERTPVQLHHLLKHTGSFRKHEYDFHLAKNELMLRAATSFFIFASIDLTHNLSPEKPRTRAMVSFLFSVSNLTLSFLTLNSRGLDFSMRVLARTLGEHCDLVRTFLFDPTICKQYLVDDPISANTFWHEHIAKGKLRDRFYSMAINGDQINGEVLDDLKTLHQDEKEIERGLSNFAHPTWVGGMLNVLMRDFEETEETGTSFDFLGRVGRRSIDIVHHVGFRLYFMQRLYWRRFQDGYFAAEGLSYDKSNISHDCLSVLDRVLDYLASDLYK